MLSGINNISIIKKGELLLIETQNGEIKKFIIKEKEQEFIEISEDAYQATKQYSKIADERSESKSTVEDIIQSVADSLSGKGQGLGIGIADNGIGINGRHKGNLYAVGQLPIGLIGDNVNGVVVFLGFLSEQLRQLLKGFSGIDHAGGVVGGI